MEIAQDRYRQVQKSAKSRFFFPVHQLITEFLMMTTSTTPLSFGWLKLTMANLSLKGKHLIQRFSLLQEDAFQCPVQSLLSQQGYSGWLCDTQCAGLDHIISCMHSSYSWGWELTFVVGLILGKVSSSPLSFTVLKMRNALLICRAWSLIHSSQL